MKLRNKVGISTLATSEAILTEGCSDVSELSLKP